jgi:hypothetical protein
MVKNTLISTSPVFLPGIFLLPVPGRFGRRQRAGGQRAAGRRALFSGQLQDMHIRQPVGHQLGVVFDGFEIGTVAHIKAVAGLV